MASRETFLKMVREALAAGRRQGEPAAPLQDVPAGAQVVLQCAREVRERLDSRRGEALERLEKQAGLMGWRVVKVATPQEAARAVADLAQRTGAKLVVRSRHPVFDGVGVDVALEAAGAKVVVMAHDSEASRARLRDAACRAELGVTGADYVVAETATVVLLTRRGVSRLVSLLPPVHVAVVRPQDVVETMEELLILWKEALPAGGDLGSYASLISGPSRTGDIEQTIVIGAHGPKEVHLVLLGS